MKFHLAMAHCKHQGQDHTQFNNQYLGNGDILSKITIAIKFKIDILHTDDISSL